MGKIAELETERKLPVVIANHQGLITFVNAPFTEAFGWRSEEIVGQPLTVLIPTYLHDAHHLGFSRFLTTGRPTLLNQPLQLRTVRKDGKEVPAEHIICAEKNGEAWIFGATIRPMET